jgi:hypothetical protein
MIEGGRNPGEAGRANGMKDGNIEIEGAPFTILHTRSLLNKPDTNPLVL